MKRILLMVLVSGLVVPGALATDSTNAVKQFMQKVQQAYKSAAYLSFNVKYRYANKDNPQRYIDTIQGEVAMDKNRMRFIIEEVETVTNDKYTIRVDHDEKLIYLSTPQPAQMADPLAMLDSALAHFEGIKAQVTHNKSQSTLVLNFPPGQPYKNITMVIDEKTGFVQRVLYELYTDGLVEKDQVIGQGGNGIYQAEGRIEILFTDYRQGQFSDALFNEGGYFTRLGQGQYEPSEKYKDYQVFLASSKL